MPGALEDGDTYSVAVSRQPQNLSQTCTTANGTGRINGADVSDVRVTCTTNQFAVGGNAYGLDGTGLRLTLNQTQEVTLTADGTFRFPQPLTDGEPFTVAIADQQQSGDCTLGNHTGMLDGAPITAVFVNCGGSTGGGGGGGNGPTFSIGGEVNGLEGDGLLLQNNGGDFVSIDANGAFAFDGELAEGDTYATSIVRQPLNPSQTCTLQDSNGVVGTVDVTDIAVNCTTDRFTVGGRVAGLDGSGLELSLNSDTPIAIAEDGGFTFPSAIPDGTPYSVTIASQPQTPEQTCIVQNGTGQLAGSAVDSVFVDCSEDGDGGDGGGGTDPDPFAVEVVVSGVQGSGLLLDLNGGGLLSVDTDGTYTFAQTLPDGAAYDVAVLRQPANPNQYCSVENGSGTIDGADAVDIAINCAIREYAVGGTVTGLEGEGLTLAESGGQTIEVSADGSFSFPQPLRDGSDYAVTVSSQPTTPNQSCSVVNGSGTVSGADVTNISVECVTERYPVQVTVNGLSGQGLLLENNGGDTLAVDASGTTTFSTTLEDGSAYSVTVARQPSSPNQICSVSGGQGSVAGGPVTDVVVDCVTERYAIGGTVQGLAGSGLTLATDGGDTVQVDANGSFTFPQPLPDGSSFSIAVAADPANPDQTCTVAQGSGTLDGGPYTAATVTCVYDGFSVGGTVDGLSGQGLTLQLNGQNDLLIANNGGFAFDTGLPDGTDYTVTVASQPTNLSQTCQVSNGMGTIQGGSVTDVQVVCTTDTFTVRGTVDGLAGDGLVLQNNGDDDFAVSQDGPGTFSFPVRDGAGYDITVLRQPSSLSQLCTVNGGSGTVDGADVTGVAVECVTREFSVGGVVSGLTGSGLSLTLNGGQALSVTADGSFQFPSTLTDGSGFDVAVATQPTEPSQTCTVSGGQGTLDGADISSVTVQCTVNRYTVGGSINGLDGSGLLMQINGGSDLEVSAGATSFEFTSTLADQSSYTVSITRQPSSPDQTCTVTNGSGSVDGGDVTDIVLDCSTATYTVGGTINDLEGTGLTLALNDGEQVTVDPGSSSFSFSNALADGSDYSVTVVEQPTGPAQACTASMGSGTVDGGDVTSVTINCVTDAFTIGGSISGLEGSGLILRNNDTDDLPVSAGSNAFTFESPLMDGSAYAVTVWRQPEFPSQTCAVDNGSGTVAGANVQDISITCTVNQFVIGGDLTGLAEGTITLANSNGETLDLTANGAFSFDQALEDGSAYDVSIAQQPAGPQQCIIADGSGTLSGSDVNTILVTCPTVEAVYPANGADWNDYVANDGADWLSASGTSCSGTAQSHADCIHGGELRTVTLPGEHSCAGLTATDALGAFRWNCDDSSGSVRFYTTALNDDTRLADLLDTSAPAWRSNRVTISREGSLYAQSPDAVWWSNTVRNANGGGALSLAGSINVVTADPELNYVLGEDAVALVVDRGVTLSGSAVFAPIVEATGQSYLWIEGRIDADGRSDAIALRDVRHSVVRAVRTMNSDTGTGYGIRMDNADNNRLESLIVAHAETDGIKLENGSDGNLLRRVTLSNNRTRGLHLTGSHRNRLVDLTVTSNRFGIYMYGATDNVLANVTAGNNALAGLEMREASNNNLFINLNTPSNNSGLFLQGASELTFENLASTDSRRHAVGMITFEDRSVVTDNNTFTGRLKVGNNGDGDCFVVGPADSPGLIGDVNTGLTCTDSGTQGSSTYTGQDSDAVLSVGASQVDTFVLNVTSDDTANPSDISGSVTYDPVQGINWVDFESRYRTWGVVAFDGDPYPAHENNGPLPNCSVVYGGDVDEATCVAGIPHDDPDIEWEQEPGTWQDTGRIRDWRLASGDQGDNGSPVSLDALAMPTADDTLSHQWSDGTSETLLRNSIEITGDGVGDDDVLCESNERCLYTPNIGAYQGHGSTQPESLLPAGALTGVLIRQHANNGL